MFRFNDELLISAPDRDLAARQFPNIFFALDHPDLRADFSRLDRLAGQAKRRSRLVGCLALGFGILSLLAFPLEPLIRAIWTDAREATSIFRIIAMNGAVFGLLAAIIGNFGIWFGKSKRRWLEARLQTERLRQWHAQYLIAHIADICVAAGDSANEAAYVQARSVAYGRFQRSVLEQVGSEYTKYTQRASVGHAGQTVVDPSAHSSFWIEPDWAADAQRKLPESHDETLSVVFRAYKETRLLGQVQYTNYILSTEGKFWSLPAKQAQILGNLTLGLVLFAFVANFTALLAAIAPDFPVGAPVLGAIAISFAILAVGVRSVEEGLHPQRELSRMESYAGAVDHARDLLLTARTPKKQIEAMILLERASFEEMVEFLSANEQSRFVL